MRAAVLEAPGRTPVYGDVGLDGVGLLGDGFHGAAPPLRRDGGARTCRHGPDADATIDLSAPDGDGAAAWSAPNKPDRRTVLTFGVATSQGESA